MNETDREKLKVMKEELNEMIERYDKDGRNDIGDLLEVAQSNIRRSFMY